MELSDIFQRVSIGVRDRPCAGSGPRSGSGAKEGC